MLLDEVGEEEDLQDGENDDKLDSDDSPERTSECHLPEAVIIEVEGPIEKVVFSQNVKKIFSYYMIMVAKIRISEQKNNKKTI